MYARIFQRSFMFNGQTFYKYDFAIGKLNIGILSSLVDKSVKHPRVNIFNSVRHCTSVTTFLTKNELAKKKIDEYLLNPDNEKQWKVMQLEIEVLRQNGQLVPEKLEPKHMYELISTEGFNKRRKYLEFLFRIEKKHEHKVEKQRLKREEHEKKRAETGEKDENEWLEYRLGRNSPFVRFFDSTINRSGNWRLIKAMMYGQKIVMDCSYEEHMSKKEWCNAAKQMMYAFAVNRDHRDPFDLHYCNLNRDGNLHNEFRSFVPTMYEPDFPINATDKSYLDLFDKNQLVYLTPDCHNDLKTYDPDAIYIIGAFVDKLGGKPISLAKAKKEGIKMAKLPIDRYLQFGGGSGKSLTLNQMMSIMLDIRSTNNWEYALRHVPQRKLLIHNQQKLRNRVDKFLKHNEEQAKVFSSTAPQDFTIRSRTKFRNN